MRPSSFVSITKNILMTTVSAYLSWNSGVACKKLSPGCESSNSLSIGLKSSVLTYFSRGFASTLNILFDVSIFSNCSSHASKNCFFVILPAFAVSIRLKVIEFKNLGNLKTFSQIGANSSKVMSFFVPNVASITFVLASATSASKGLPSS